MSHKLQKPYTEKQRVDFVVEHNHNRGLEIKETDSALFALEANEIMQNGEPAANPKYEAEQLEKAKNAKLQENETKRDEYLQAGVIYKGILFDSDTDQKTNLQFVISTISDNDEITWFGKNNESLLCKKEDLVGIACAIADLTAEVWGIGGLNLSIINSIKTGKSLGEIEAIEINY